MNFRQTPEFEKELKKLSKKYRSLADDLRVFQSIVRTFPEGNSKNFAVLRRQNDTSIIKARLFCESLRDSSLRIVYSYHQQSITFLFIELYQKSQKPREDKSRIEKYILLA